MAVSTPQVPFAGRRERAEAKMADGGNDERNELLKEWENLAQAVERARDKVKASFPHRPTSARVNPAGSSSGAEEDGGAVLLGLDPLSLSSHP